jgi:hypothetical protein
LILRHNYDASGARDRYRPPRRMSRIQAAWTVVMDDEHNEIDQADLDRPVSQPRHFAVKIAVRVGYGPIALKAEPIEETKETGIILA